VCRRTAYITDYEGVCTDVGDAGTAQQSKRVSRSKMDWDIAVSRTRGSTRVGVRTEGPQQENQRTSTKFHIAFFFELIENT
jgi:hypothetical protein